jgi:nucleotide-binding universal stress UspA family protein
MFRDILVPLDGSALAERALPYARLLAGGTGRLQLMRATMGRWHPGFAGIEAQDANFDEVQQYLARIASEVELTGGRASYHVQVASPAEAIRQEAPLADSVVMVTHGRHGLDRLIHGSVAEDVLRQDGVPVFLVPARCARAWLRSGPADVLVPLDGSALGEAAIGPAVELAARLSTGLILLQACEPFGATWYGSDLAIPPDLEPLEEQARGYLDSVAGSLRERGLSVTTRVIVGSAVGAVLAMAAHGQVAAIAMATHGRTGLAATLMGTVSSLVARHASVPVMVTRPALLGARQPLRAERSLVGV